VLTAWYRHGRNRLSPARRRRPAAVSLGRRSGLGVELLEDRRVPTAYSVSTTGDSGPGSLRQAILDANSNPGPDTIQFGIGSGSKTTDRHGLWGGRRL
jgi:hypothetical protein